MLHSLYNASGHATVASAKYEKQIQGKQEKWKLNTDEAK